MKPTQTELREQLDYDPATGALIWKDRGVGRSFRRGGKQAGWLRPDGYLHMQVGPQAYYAHCVIWCWMTGEWPTKQIDHRNRARADNAWANLRLATASQNKANIVARNAINAKGIEVLPNGKFRARIRARGSDHHLGCFPSLGEAKDAYAKAAVEIFGEFARV